MVLDFGYFAKCGVTYTEKYKLFAVSYECRISARGRSLCFGVIDNLQTILCHKTLQNALISQFYVWLVNSFFNTP